MKTISVLGCGWLGAPLARNLLPEGYTVKGSTTRPEKKSVMKDVGIRPYLLQLNPELKQLTPTDFFETDLLIVNIPPKTREQGQDFHPRQIEAVAAEIARHRIRNCIYISSTSVYPILEREVTEEDVSGPESNRHPALWKAEESLRGLPDLNLTILRCGGLMGYDRIPGRYFAGKKDLDSAEIPVNYIHRDDVIGVILAVINRNYWNETINVVAPEHPTRRQVYEQNAAEFNFEAPSFGKSVRKNFNIISPVKLIKDLEYNFLYPDPLKFRYR